MAEVVGITAIVQRVRQREGPEASMGVETTQGAGVIRAAAGIET